MSRYGAAEVLNDFAKELKHTKANPFFRFTKAVQRHANIRDQNPSNGTICPGEPHHPNLNAPKFDGMARAMCPWSSVEAGQK